MRTGSLTAQQKTVWQWLRGLNTPRLRKVLWYGLLAGLSIFALSHFNLAGLTQSISQISWWLIAVLAILQLASIVMVNAQWHKVAQFSRAQLTFRDMFRINCQGAVMDSITPGVKIGGEVTRAVQISRTGNCCNTEAAAVVAVQKLFSLSAFIFINLFALGYLVRTPAVQAIPGATALQIAVYGVLVSLLVLFLAIFIAPHKLSRALLRKENAAQMSPRATQMLVKTDPQHAEKPAASHRLRTFALSLLQQVKLVRQNTKACVYLVMLSFAIWLMYPLKMYLLATQIYPDAHAIYLTAVTFAAYLVAMIPLFPGGLGGFEGTMTGLLLLGGFATGSALVITVIFRFFTFWFTMLISLVYLALERPAEKIAATTTEHVRKKRASRKKKRYKYA